MSDQREPPDRLIVVSNRLPVTVKASDSGYSYAPSVGGLATTLNTLRSEMEMIWIGAPGLDIPDPQDQAVVRRELREQFDSIPVFLDAATFDAYYNGFSNGSIWPLFHYFPQYAHYDSDEWRAYQSINQNFCEAILKVAQPTDTIWVHDYHLMLLPAMLHKVLPDTTIGYFLHIPFPSYEIFRMLPWREEILQGLVGADLIGFHTYGYARHFLSSLLRLLGYEQDFGWVTLDDRRIKIDTFPLGVDLQRFEDARDSKASQSEVNDLRDQVGDRKVILSVDRLDFTKGILERLRAYESFLRDNPDWYGKVQLISLLVPSRTRVPEYRSLKRQVDELIGKVNGEFGQPGWTPITYLYRSVPFERLVSLYRIADVALVTPLRDGMNLVAKEYLASRPDGSGVLILSETAGAAEELGEAIIVNPHDEEEMVEGIHQALTMPLEEQKNRNLVMRRRLARYDTQRWAREFMQALGSQRLARRKRLPRRLTGNALEDLLDKYEGASKRLLLLDYDGTLVPFAPTPSGAEPDPDLLHLLKGLVADPKNTLVAISGRDSDTLESWLGGVGIDLVAEHGARIRLAGQEDWENMVQGVEDGWKEKLKPVFEVFVDRTPGSLLEEKGTALVWHYRRAEPGLGSQRAAELTETLEGYLANTSLHILQGHKVVEVKPSSVSKGRAAHPWLHGKTEHDFIIAIGDDVTDEALFEVVPEDQWSIKVGIPETSRAKFYVSSVHVVRELLDAFLNRDD
ncbi:MAG: bifunctional alpha,alpha-trehalose-phosphate synthase (UDP-forming)/trehalose-phosphatase [Anaerolineales bacterium]|nr:MAG: bifunctional alpha,alpha-trehalose-phosphate synthase (UDP-forming)/trehalose-phosphatase [Anaerolineales bacterium]